MIGDITLKEEGAFGYPGDETQIVLANGSAPSILAGEPVVKSAIGAPDALPMPTNAPVVATDFVVGIAATTSTETTALDGVVKVMKFVPGVTYLIAPNVAATWDTQAKYDALVGNQVLLDLTNGVYTILSTHGATNGCVVMPLDIAIYPGKVAFTFRAGASYLA